MQKRRDRDFDRRTEFAKWVRATREDMGLTPQQCAARATSPRTGGVISASAWNKIESSSTKNVYKATVEMICEALGVPLQDGVMIAYAQSASVILADYEMPGTSMAQYASLDATNKGAVHTMIHALANQQRHARNTNMLQAGLK